MAINIILKASFFLLIVAIIVYPKFSYAINITVRIGDQYTEVSGGDRLYFEVEIKYPENSKRKDLRLEYQIIENGELIASEKVLRAIETQTSFLDYIVVPKSAKAGIKELRVIVADYQELNDEVFATFRVLKSENKTGARFFPIGFAFLAAIFAIYQVVLIKRRIRIGRLAPHEYSEIPRERRIFYEIISDIIMQMRYHAGDKAIDIAEDIDDLAVDASSGRVLEIKKSPEKIIALLILKYEKMLGKKVNFMLRKPDGGAQDRLAAINKNLIIVRKYFE